MKNFELKHSGFSSILGKTSLIIRNKRIFLTTVAVISILKLLLSAITPASYELKYIVDLFYSGKAPIGPWVILYPPLCLPGITRGVIDSWLTSLPMSTGASTMGLSILFRLPIFIFDLGTMGVLYITGTKLGQPHMARLASLIWFLNPYTLLSVELSGLPDVVPVFLIVCAFNLSISRRFLPAAATVAVGIFFKFFPLILVLPMFLSFSTRAFSRKQLATGVLSVLIGFIGYLGWILPSGFLSLTQYTPVTQPIPFINGTPVVIGTGYTVSPSAFGMISLYGLLILFSKRDALIPTLLSTIMAYYLLASPSPQYFVWALPLIALDVAFVSRSRALLAAIFYSLAFMYWFLGSYAFLTPSGYSLLMIPIGASNPSIYVLQLRRFFENDQLLNVIILPLVYSTLFASTLVYVVDAARSWFAQVPSKQRERNVEAP